MENSGSIVVRAGQGASYYDSAYEYLMVLETELRKRKFCDQVPMTFVPYIGHLGLGLGDVGERKGMLESALRDKAINWVTIS